MTDYEISQLSALTALSTAIQLLALDTSDTSTAPAGPGGSDKRLPLALLDARYRAAYKGTSAVFRVDEYGADPTGTADSTSAFVSAAAAATAAVTAGAPQAFVVPGMGQYKVSGGSISVSGKVGFAGPGAGACTILAQGSGAVFTRSMTGAPSTYGRLAPISGLAFDGTGMGSSTGYAVKDTDCGHATYADLDFLNFTGTGSAGLAQLNSSFWAEQVLGLRLLFTNNTIGHLQDGQSSAGPPSFDYSDFLGVHYNTYPGQSGRTVQGNAPALGGSYRSHANAHVSSGAAQTVWTVGSSAGDTSSVSSDSVDLTGEVDGTGSTAYDFTVGAAAGLFLSGTVQLPGFAANPAGGSGILSGNVNSPTYSRPIYKAVATGSGPAAGFGLYEHSTFGYALQLPQSAGSPAAVPGISTGVGVPAFTAPQGSLYIRQDTPGTLNQRIYMNTSSGSGTTWTALSV